MQPGWSAEKIRGRRGEAMRWRHGLTPLWKAAVSRTADGVRLVSHSCCCAVAFCGTANARFRLVCLLPGRRTHAPKKRTRTASISLDDHRISWHDILCGSVGRKRHRETVLKCTLFRWCSIVSMLFRHTNVNVRLMHNVTNILLQSIVINRANSGVLQVILRMGYSVCPVVRLGFRVKIGATVLRPTRRLSRKNLAHAACSWPFGCLGSGFPVAPRCSGRQREAEGRAGSSGGRGKTLGDKSSFLSSGYYFLWW